MDYDIVPAAEEDWPWIVEGSLEMLRANSYPGELRDRDPEDTRRGLAEAIDERRRDRTHAVFVAVDRRGRRLGFAWADLTPVEGGDPRGLLVGTFVERRYRRKRIGRAVALTAMDWAWGCGASHVEASIGGANETSQAFHAALGFRARTVVMEYRP